MQIFAAYDDPVRCARVLDDRRLNKAILESAQLLCTAAYLNGIDPSKIPLKPTHKFHPLTKWCRQLQNARWLWKHLIELCCEKFYRTGKNHSYSEEVLDRITDLLDLFPSPLTTNVVFCNCTPYKDMDVHLAYRKTLRDKWQKEIASRQKPVNPRWKAPKNEKGKPSSDRQSPSHS